MKKVIIFLFISISSLIFCQNIVFKDKIIEKEILKIYDKNNDGFINKKETEDIRNLDLSNKEIEYLSDISNFSNLEKIILTNNLISKINLENLPKLKEFYCAGNKLIEFKIKNLENLEKLALSRNYLKSISIKNSPKIESLYLFSNQLTEINLKKFPNLKFADLDNNNLIKLDISKNPKLIQITISHNKITELDITNNNDLKVNILYRDNFVKIKTNNKNNIEQASLPPPPVVIQK